MPQSSAASGADFDFEGKQCQQQQGLVLKQLMETFKPGMNFNDPVYMAASTILSDMLSKSRIGPTDPSSVEVTYLTVDFPIARSFYIQFCCEIKFIECSLF